MITAADTFKEMQKRITKEKAQKLNASFLFNIGGDKGDKWSVDLTKDTDWVTHGDNPKAQCTVEVANESDWVAIATGKMNPTMAFMQGKVKIKGDMSLALKLQSLIS